MGDSSILHTLLIKCNIKQHRQITKINVLTDNEQFSNHFANLKKYLHRNAADCNIAPKLHSFSVNISVRCAGTNDCYFITSKV